MTDLHDQIAGVPQGLYVGASRYETDNELVLTIWDTTRTYDLRVPKGDPGCAGRHCRHDGLCRRTPAPREPQHVKPVPMPVWEPPNSRELTYCTCPTIWNAIIPPPPCPMHGTFSMPTITCTTIAADPP